MKHILNRRNITTQVYLVTKVLIVAATFCLSYAFKEKVDDLWEQLGIEKEAATSNIKASFLGGYLRAYGARNIRNIASGDKMEVAKDLLAYTKQYVTSNFKTDYDNARRSAKPVEPAAKTLRTKEEIQKDEISNMQDNITRQEASLKTATPQVQAILKPGIEQSKKILGDYKRPGNELFAMMELGEKNDQEREIQNYKKAVSDCEVKYPEDYRIVVRERLQKLLEVTKDVDFNAELKEQYGKKRFVNPTYEAKSPEWKMAFRAGKDVTELTRAFAQQWLNEMK